MSADPSNAPPSIDPADQDSLVGVLRSVLDKHLQGVDDMLPARVVAFDRKKNRVQVAPMIRVVTTAGQTVGRAQLSSLPVIQIGGGGHVLLFNLKAGDLGWIKANDRDVSLFLQGFAESQPNTMRKHSFSDAVFIPDVMKDWELNPEDEENAVLQSLDGTLRISLGSERIKLTAGPVSFSVTPAGIDIQGGTIKHNGNNIGDTHSHPQGPDSDGNSEQDVGPPK